MPNEHEIQEHCNDDDEYQSPRGDGFVAVHFYSGDSIAAQLSEVSKLREILQSRATGFRSADTSVEVTDVYGGQHLFTEGDIQRIAIVTARALAHVLRDDDAVLRKTLGIPSEPTTAATPEPVIEA